MTFNKYTITQGGSIISKYNGSARTSYKDKKGYHHITMTQDCGKKKTFLVHRLVAMLHVPNPEGKPQVNHIDGNKSNNDYRNLEWVTGQENVQYSVDTGLVKRGDARPNAKLSDEAVLEMRRLQKEGLNYYELGRRFNVAYQTAHKVCSNQTYTHI